MSRKLTTTAAMLVLALISAASMGLGTRLTEKFRDELDRIQGERKNVQARLEEVSDTEEQARRLREILRMVEEYLADLPTSSSRRRR